MKTQLLVVALLYLISFTFSSCSSDSDDNSPPTQTNQSSGDLSIIGISPSQGFYPGGLEVTITGTGFDTNTTVTIGGNNCTSVTINSANNLACLTPQSTAGTFDVVVDNSVSNDSLASAFTYKNFTTVSTIAGDGVQGSTDGAGNIARFSDSINDIIIDPSNSDIVYVLDGNNYKIRKLDLSSVDPNSPASSDAVVSTFVGSGSQGNSDGIGTAATLLMPTYGQAVDGVLFFSDADWSNSTGQAVRAVDLATGQVTTLKYYTNAEAVYPEGLVVKEGFLYFSECNIAADLQSLKISDSTVSNWVGVVGGWGFVDGASNVAQFGCPWGMDLDPSGNYLYVADLYNGAIRKVDMSTKETSTVSTDFFYTNLGDPSDIEAADGYLFISGFDDPIIQEIDLSDNSIRTIAGTSGTQGSSDGVAGSATFRYPHSITYHPKFGLFITSGAWGWGTTDYKVRLLH